MNKKGWLFASGVAAAAMVTALWMLGTPTTEEDISMEERLENLKLTHDARLERISTISDQRLSMILRDRLFRHYYGALESVAFDSAPYEIEYATRRLERLTDYADVNEMATVYMKNFVAKSTSRNAQCFQIRAPFTFPFAHRLHMQTLTMADGETLQMPDILSGQRQTAELRDRGDSVCFQQPRSADAAMPVSVKAEFTTHLPDDLVVFEFTREDVGMAQRRAGYTVTLIEMNNYSYEIEVDASDINESGVSSEDIIGEALAENGRFIQPRVTDKVRTEDYRRRDELIDELIDRAVQNGLSAEEVDKEIEALREDIKKERGTAVFKAFAFHGAVDTAQVTLLHSEGAQEEIKHSLDIPFYSLLLTEVEEVAADNFPALVVPGPVYNYHPAVRAERADLTVADMPGAIEIRHRNISPQHDPGVAYPAQLFFHYPDVQSDRFIQIFDRYGSLEPGDVEFFDKNGDPILLPEGGNDLLRFTVSRLEFNPHAFPQLPARVKATIPVLTAPDLVKHRFAADELPEGVSLDGNRLSIDYATFAPKETEDTTVRRVERRNQVFGKDADGRYLAEVGATTQLRQHGEPVELYYFYGEPEVFEIWYRGEMQTVGFEIDVELEMPTQDAGG